MSTFSDKDIERKEAIEKLKGERIELLEEFMLVPIEEINGDRYRGLFEKIAIIDDQIKTLQALDHSQV